MSLLGFLSGGGKTQPGAKLLSRHGQTGKDGGGVPFFSLSSESPGGLLLLFLPMLLFGWLGGAGRSDLVTGVVVDRVLDDGVWRPGLVGGGSVIERDWEAPIPFSSFESTFIRGGGVCDSDVLAGYATLSSGLLQQRLKKEAPNLMVSRSGRCWQRRRDLGPVTDRFRCGSVIGSTSADKGGQVYSASAVWCLSMEDRRSRDLFGSDFGPVGSLLTSDWIWTVVGWRDRVCVRGGALLPPWDAVVARFGGGGGGSSAVSGDGGGWLALSLQAADLLSVGLDLSGPLHIGPARVYSLKLQLVWAFWLLWFWLVWVFTAQGMKTAPMVSEKLEEVAAISSTKFV